MTTARVLLVEDDEEQASLFTQALTLSGYAVDTVSTITEAQARLTDEAFTLLLTDWELGDGMQGDALVCWTRRQCPDVKIILFSNHSRIEIATPDCQPHALFRKMDGIAELRRLVAQWAPKP